MAHNLPGFAKLTSSQRSRITRRKSRAPHVVARLDASLVDHLQHTINTQMNGVVGMLEMLQQTQLDDDQRSMLDTAQRNAEKLLGESGRLLRWNLNDVPQGDAPESASTIDINILPFEGARILAVDDNAVNLQVVERMLARLGCLVDTASSGADALILTREQEYDLILMDCQMPELDGYQTTALFRAEEHQKTGDGHTPVIGWSARTGRKERDTCLAIGMDDFIAKPVRTQELTSLLGRWLPAANQTCLTIEAPEDELDVTQEMFGDAFAELANLFLSDTPPRIAALAQAASERNHAQAAKCAHTLCGSSASIGATSLAALCRDLEIGARDNGGVDAVQLQSVQNEYARIAARLNAMLQQEAESHRRNA